MNPGGLREDMLGLASDPDYPKTVTYKGAAVVQPFANTLVNMDLTGANIKLALEQQWQRDRDGNVPSRPFLRLGVSKGFTYTFDASRPEGDRITGMWLDGEPIDPAATYSVTVNSFLASGGDNFRAFNNGTNKADTGKVDLEAMVDYLAEFAAEQPLAVDYGQRAVGVRFPAGAPAEYDAGGTVEFAVSSWAMSAPIDAEDSELTVELGDQVLGTFPVDNTIGTAVFDEYGTASVSVDLPSDVAPGEHELVLRGATTGTQAVVPITVAQPPSATVTADDVSVVYPDGGSVTVTVDAGSVEPTGTISLEAGGETLGPVDLVDGSATVAIPERWLKPGTYPVTASYSGNAELAPATGSFTLTVQKAGSSTRVAVRPGTTVEKGTRATFTATVTGPDGVPVNGKVRFRSGTDVVEVRLTDDGRATWSRTWKAAGERTVRVTYLGSAYLRTSSEVVEVRVTR